MRWLRVRCFVATAAVERDGGELDGRREVDVASLTNQVETNITVQARRTIIPL